MTWEKDLNGEEALDMSVEKSDKKPWPHLNMGKVREEEEEST